MKERMVKILSLSLVVFMLVTVFSVSAFAYTSDYVTIDCPENFDERDYGTGEGFYVDVMYQEWYTAEDGETYYTDNTVNICMEACWDDVLEDYYFEEEIDSLKLYLEGMVDSIDKTDYYYTTIGGYDAVVYDVYYTYTGETMDGKRLTAQGLYSEVIIVNNKCCVSLYIDVMNEDDFLLKRNQLAEEFFNSITYNVEAIEKAEAEEKRVFAIITAVVLGGLLFGLVVVIVVVVVIVKATKKKKAEQPILPYNTSASSQYYPNVQSPYGNQQINMSAQPSQAYVQSPATEENKENNTESLDN